ncbi:MAG: response regulator transcription factor [Sandaracinaceae bacterium]|nr:response regulator transcription factor [Sandaracinaceae bacterium]
MRLLLVDDEPIARARLRRLAARLGGVEVVGEAASGAEALRLARELAPDALLLDIDMPGLDGLGVAEALEGPAVIFTTAHPQHALEAFEVGAHDYLLKPVSLERLARALEKVRARRGAGEEPWRLVVGDGSLRRFVDAREVSCFVADQKYVVFRHEDRELLLRESLDALEGRLAPYGFLRVSRGALVRRDAVDAWDTADGGTVVLADGTRVPVSRRAAPAVRAALGLDR